MCTERCSRPLVRISAWRIKTRKAPSKLKSKRLLKREKYIKIHFFFFKFIAVLNIIHLSLLNDTYFSTRLDHVEFNKIIVLTFSLLPYDSFMKVKIQVVSVHIFL